MNTLAVKHIPKSNMAYALDQNSLYILLQTASNDVEKVEVLIGDPFIYNKTKVNDIEGWLWEGRINAPHIMQKCYSSSNHDYFEIIYQTSSWRTKYAFLIYTKEEVYFYGCWGIKSLGKIKDFKLDRTPAVGSNWDSNEQVFNLFNYFNFPCICHADIYQAPAWSKTVTWYQIFMDRFYPSNTPNKLALPFGSVTKGIHNHQYFGGCIQGVIEKIPYLKSLGITGIYFTPIFDATSAHKYDTRDYLLIDPQFGTNEDFRRLVEECHKNDIKIILDAVFNHCGWSNALFQDVVKNKKASPYYDCFFIDDDDFIDFPLDDKGMPNVRSYNRVLKFKTFACTPFMPKLNTEHPLMEEYLLNITRYWMEYGIDGWRLDVSNEVSHDFWRKFRKLVKTMNPDAYIVGENWDDANPWLSGDQFDAVMNYGLSYPIWQFFGKAKNDYHINAEEFKDAIIDLLVRYPKNTASSMFNLIDSHDTMRILNRCGMNKNLVKLAYVFMFSFPGAPTIYYGDEVGMEGEHDPDNRRCMLWNKTEQDLDMFAFIQQLIKLRNDYPAFIMNDFTWHEASDNVLVYEKGDLLFIINKNDTSRKIELPLTFTSCYDIWHEVKVNASNIEVSANSFKIYQKEK